MTTLTRQGPVELETQSMVLRAIKCSLEIRRHFQAWDGILWKKESIGFSLTRGLEIGLANFG